MIYLLCFSVAVFSTTYIASLPSLFFYAVIGCLLLLSVYWRLFVCASIFAGLCIGFLQGERLVKQQLPIGLDGSSIHIEGRIEGLPKADAHKRKFVLLIEDVISPEPSSKHLLADLLGQKIQLSWFVSQASSHLTKLVPGQRWRLKVRLRRPRGFVNPAGFDYQVHLIRQHIYASGYVVSQASNRLLGRTCKQTVVDCVRGYIGMKIRELPITQNAQGPLIALAIGDSQWLSQDQWELFKRTGTIHLLAISGLHIGLAAAIGFYIGRLFLKGMSLIKPYSSRWHCAPACFSILLAFLYSLLAGMSLPTQRALVMVLLFQLASLWGVRIHAFLLLSCALFWVALTDPLAVHNQGFWLSFLAVALLLYGFSGRNTVHSVEHETPKPLGLACQSMALKYCLPILQSQWILTIGLWLPSLLWLQGTSLSAPLANILAISWVSFVIVPGLFALLLVIAIPVAALATIEIYLSYVLDAAVQILLSVLTWIDHFTWPFWYPNVSQPSWVAIVFCALGIILIMLPRGVMKPYIALVFLFPLVFTYKNNAPLEITFMDAGQGTATTVQTLEHTLVYDTGRAFSHTFNVGEHIIAPYLRSKGTQKADRVIISHSDGDHAGGLSGLLKSIQVNHFLLGESLGIPSVAHKANMCRQGQQWQWGGVSFDVLWPNEEQLLASDSKNNRSCVVLIQYQNKRILLTGDIERSVERRLLAHPLLAQGVDIMLVPHHGSKTSSGSQWVEQLHPKWAVVSAGYKNQYRHPHPTIKKRYLEAGSRLMNTAELGALRWVIKPNGDWRVEQWRRDYARYWFD